MGYNVLDVARYVINYCNRKGYDISNLKLQKFLYFIQADYLTYENRECFREDIQAWNFGPVVPEVYHEFKIFGGGSIPTVTEYNFFDYDNIKFERRCFDENVIRKADREKIASELDSLSEYSATTLVNVSHKQRPWKDAFDGTPNRIITKESIRNYFRDDE